MEMPDRWKYNFALVFFTGILVSGAANAAERDLSRPPPDSAEAERVRIWVPVYRKSRCLMTIDILNDSAQVIRRLVNDLKGPGYYNFYWNKKDDQGNFVEPGDYTCRIKNCTNTDYGSVTASYKEWERLFRFVTPCDTMPDTFSLQLERDSAIVSLLMYNRRGLIMDSAIVDSLMMQGDHRWQWSPKRRLPRGIYTAKLRIGDFVDEYDFFYVPN